MVTRGEKGFKIVEVRLRISHWEVEIITTYAVADTDLGEADIVAFELCHIQGRSTLACVIPLPLQAVLKYVIPSEWLHLLHHRYASSPVHGRG